MPTRVEPQLIKLGSPCNDNLYPGGPVTVREAKALGQQPCPHLAKCNASGALHRLTGFQCTMALGADLARGVLLEDNTLDEELRGDFGNFFKGVNPRHGFIYSADRTEFVTVTDKDEALEKVREFAAQLLSETHQPERTTDSGPRDLNDLIARSTDANGAVDLLKMQSFEGSRGSNGGRGCDVSSGPCSCGAWH